MNLFLTCFLACLFAFVVVVVLSIQVIGFLVKRWFYKNLPEILSQAMHGGTGAQHPVDNEALRELIANAAQMPPGVTPHLSAVTCQCGYKVTVPLAEELPPFLQDLGWKCEERFNGWGCPACVQRLAG